THTNSLDVLLFFSNGPPPSTIYALSLHDALPIYVKIAANDVSANAIDLTIEGFNNTMAPKDDGSTAAPAVPEGLHAVEEGIQDRSEEHTSELQSRFDLVCRLLLEKKNDNIIKNTD